MLKIVPTAENLSSPATKGLEKCTVCEKAFYGKAALATHLLRSHKISKKNDTNKAYYCPLESCSHSINGSHPFCTFAAIKQHYKLVHQSARFKCSLCSRIFKTKYSCREHEMDCGLKYACSCNVAYTTKRGLLEHIKRQNHKMPQSLKSLLEAKKKLPKKVNSANAQPKKGLVSTRLILPKTLKKKIKLLNIDSDRSCLLRKQLLQDAGSKITKVVPDAKQLSMTAVPTTPVAQTKTSSPRRTVALQLPLLQQHQLAPQTQTSYLPHEETGTAAQGADDWLHKSISIQTEENFGNPGWMSLEDEVEKILFENIATQTNESIFEHPLTETDSTMCQTDWRPRAVAEPPMIYPNYNNYCPNQTSFGCDVQIQTVANQMDGMTQGTISYPVNSHVFPIGQFATAAGSACTLPSINIETQTDEIVHHSSIETQTVEQLLLDNFEQTPLSTVDAEMSTLDVFLNNIETQTDVLLSPWSEHQIATFAHSCTQTPDPDFLSEILDLDAQRQI